MDKRNYNELYEHTLGSCDCDEDNNCGCTFYEHTIDFICDCTPEQDCNCKAEAEAETETENKTKKINNKLAKSK